MSNVKIIKPKKGLIGINIKEIIEFRELLYFLTWRDIKVKYKQTLIGGLWAMIQPLFTMVIFTIFFGKMANIPSDNIPYPIFSYAGLLLWTYFSNALSSASESLIRDDKLVSKTYCPRIIIPTSATLSGLLDYAVASIILIGLMIYYHFTPTIYIFLIPVTIFFSWMLASGLGYILSSLNVKYRDIRYAIPFFLQLLIFFVPIIYPVSIIPTNYRWILFLNPMTAFIETHRAVILGHPLINWYHLTIAIILTAVIFIIGIAYFKARENSFADVI